MLPFCIGFTKPVQNFMRTTVKSDADKRATDASILLPWRRPRALRLCSKAVLFLPLSLSLSSEFNMSLPPTPRLHCLSVSAPLASFVMSSCMRALQRSTSAGRGSAADGRQAWGCAGLPGVMGTQTGHRRPALLRPHRLHRTHLRAGGHALDGSDWGRGWERR